MWKIRINCFIYNLISNIKRLFCFAIVKNSPSKKNQYLDIISSNPFFEKLIKIKHRLLAFALLMVLVFCLLSTGCSSEDAKVKDRLNKEDQIANPSEDNHKYNITVSLRDKAQLLYEKKRFSQAVEYLEDYLRSNSDDIEAMKILVRAYHALEDYDKALSISYKLSDMEFEDAEIHTLLGKIYLHKQGDPAKAVMHYEKALLLDKEDQEIFFNLMKAYFYNNDIPKILEPLQEFFDNNPDNYRAALLLGETYIECGRLLDAQRVLKKAIDLNPEEAIGYILLGEAYMDHKQFDESLKYLEMAKKYNPREEDVYLDIGEIYYWRGDYKTAEEYIRKAMNMNPLNFSPYNEIGNLYYFQGRYKEAERYHKLSLERYPGYYDAYKGLGKVYIKQKKYDEAEEAFKKALELKPYFQGETCIFLAEYYDLAGRFKDQEEILLYAIKTDPHYREPYLLLIKFYNSRSMTNEAIGIEELMNNNCTPDKQTFKTGQ